MRTVQAKFRLAQLDTPAWAPEGSASVVFYGVQGEPFGSATPSAYCTMLIHNAAAAGMFKHDYTAYLADVVEWQTSEQHKPADQRAPAPKQPEYLVTFELAPKE